VLFLKFPTSIEGAKEYQREIVKHIILSDSFSNTNIIGAFDIAYKGEEAFAACVIYDSSLQTIIEQKTIKARIEFPYIPGYLFLREVPHFLKLLEKIEKIPEIAIVDGQGIAHPRSAGSATIFGLITGIPTIGVAKKPMRYFTYRKIKNKNLEEIYLHEKKVGFRHSFVKKWNPIYISPGHKISPETAYKIVKNLLTEKYKLPIPQYLAHNLAAEYKRKFS